jgi:hypothetical protein
MEPTWDLFIIITLSAFTVYGLLIGKRKILGILVNLYIALLVTMVAGELVYGWVSNFAIISNNLTASLFGTRVLMFAIITGLLIFKSETSGLDTGSSLSKVQTGLYGFLGGALALASIFSFMTETQLVGLDSNFALIIFGYFSVWVLAPVILMIGSSWLKR